MCKRRSATAAVIWIAWGGAAFLYTIDGGVVVSGLRLALVSVGGLALLVFSVISAALSWRVGHLE